MLYPPDMLTRRHTVVLLAVLLSLSGCRKLFKRRGAPDAGAFAIATSTGTSPTSTGGALGPDPTLA